MIVANGLAGLWVLAAEVRPALRQRAMWWCTAAAQVAIAVQVVLGVLVVGGDTEAAPRLHMFYGFVALVTVGILYSYRQQVPHRIHLLYGFGGLFLMGLALRAHTLHR